MFAGQEEIVDSQSREIWQGLHYGLYLIFMFNLSETNPAAQPKGKATAVP